jgi:hypothetical protein
MHKRVARNAALASVLTLSLDIAQAQIPLTAASPASAASSASSSYQPGSWTLGAWSITPQLALAAGFNDNLRLQPTDAIASPFVAAFPTVEASTDRGDDRYDVQWHGEWTRFTQSRADDTIDDELSADGLQVLDARTGLAWRLVWQDWHENLGLARTDEIAGSPAHVRTAAADLVWRHDLDAVDGPRLEFEPEISFKHYLDQREITSEADQSSLNLTARGLATMTQRDRFGPEVRYARNRFPAGTQAGDNYGIRALLLWQRDPPSEDATGDSPGHVGVGYETRTFDQLRPHYGGFALDFAWSWVRGANTFSLQGLREARDAPTEDVDELVDEHIVAGLSREWGSTWQGALSLTLGHEHYVGALFPRDDHLDGLELTLQHDLSRRWRLTFHVACLRRRSEVQEFGFTRWLGSVEVAGAL